MLASGTPKQQMDPTAKPKMLIIPLLRIKAIRVGKARGITVACGQGQRKEDALGNDSLSVASLRSYVSS
jgi:hypothetical protein